MLGETVKRLCKDAGIGQFTNHSLRTTTATGGLQKGVPGGGILCGQEQQS